MKRVLDSRRPARQGGRPLGGRVGFWRAMIEVLAVATLWWAGTYLLARALAAPWAEIISFGGFGIYGWAAWRLERGTGPLWRRAARMIVWTLLLGALGGVLGWAVSIVLPIERRFLGLDPQELRFSFPLTVFSYALVTVAVFLPIRGVLSLWQAGRERLRWQLTASYLLVGLLATLLLPFAFAVFVALVSLSIDPVVSEPRNAAERAGLALRPLILGNNRAAVQAALEGLVDGSTRLPVPSDGPFDLDPNAEFFAGLRRIVVLEADGTPTAFAPQLPGQNNSVPPDIADYGLLFEQARRGSCVPGRPAGGPLVDAAVCPIADNSGQVAALVLVESVPVGSTQISAAFTRGITFVLLSTSVVLYLLPLIAFAVLPLALIVGYWLARRLTRRVERLTEATSHLAAGQYSRRVTVDSHDEIGRLSHDFNAMAQRLEEREQALRAEKERSEQLLQANRRLTADVSHELRTPLTTLRGYVEALSQDFGDRLPARDLEVIEAEIGRLQALIDDLFTLARTEARQLPLVIEELDASLVALRLAETLMPLARRERRIELVTELAPELPPVLADRTRLEQVLLNLLHNALRHTAAGGIVAVRGSLSGKYMLLTIADTGAGISHDDLPHVFERFYRGDSSRARETGGAGLGLALVHELVTAMGGEVFAASTPGRGSEFTIALPLAPLTDAALRGSPAGQGAKTPS